LARAAEEAAGRGEITASLTHWREALELLPVGSKQHEMISAKITELGKSVQGGIQVAGSRSGQNGAATAAGLGAVGLMLWKLKALLLGLGKGSTLLSMVASLGVYWSIWGWKFALGLVLSIYVHDMGHVFALKRYGFRASAPMFVPGLGAMIRLQQRIVNPLEDAEIGLAGPIYGFGAAVVAAGLWLTTGSPIFAAIAGVGAWINLFNLLPVSTLDGGRGFHAMSRLQKFLAGLTVAGAWLVTQDGLLLVVGLVCLGRAFGDKSTAEGSWKTTIVYCVLVVLLSAVSMMRLLTGEPALLNGID
jgi:Zn-dependent protease